MPIIDFTNPFYLISAVILYSLCTYLAKTYKSNTIPCIMLLTFLAMLVGHTIELAVSPTAADTARLTVCVVIDEAFTFVSFLSFLWMDRLQVETMLKTTKGKKSAGKKGTTREIIIKDDGLDILWKQV